MDWRALRPYSWALVLALFIPASWILRVLPGTGLAVFAAAGLGIVPLAWFMGLATEELGKHAGPGIGGLLNATFGNATELIIATFVLFSSLEEGARLSIVTASLTGSVIGNILLVLGLSMVVGGLRHKSQVFSREASGIQTSMLLLAVVGLVMPALYVRSTGAMPAILEEMSLGIAAILLAAYVLGLLFSLRTHRDIFNPVTEAAVTPHWSLRFSLTILLVCAAFVAVESELLVSSLESARSGFGFNDLFLGVIIVAIIGNAAEHGGAVLLAYRNQMDLSVAIATTSTTQVALFVAPFLVFASIFSSRVITLDFEIFELVSIALSAGILGAVVSDGRSNWYEGVLLIMVYAIIGVAFFFHP